MSGFVNREFESRENVIGTGFEETPLNNATQMMILGEISHLTVPIEESKRYYVNYEVFWRGTEWEVDTSRFGTTMTFGEFCDCFPLSSTTTVCKPVRIGTREYAIVGFNMPIEFHFITNHSEKDYRDNTIVKQPIMYFEVFSLDNYDVNRYEGRCMIELPTAAGTVDLELNVMRETGGFWQELKRDLIGCFSPIRDKEDWLRRSSSIARNDSAIFLTRTSKLKLKLSTSLFNGETRRVAKALHDSAIVAAQVSDAYRAATEITSKGVKQPNDSTDFLR